MSASVAMAKVTIDLSIDVDSLVTATATASAAGVRRTMTALGTHGVRRLIHGELTRVLSAALRSSDLEPWIGDPHIQVDLDFAREAW